jgi:hypothetical protein
MTVLSTSAFAQATRTWVSGVGDDVNPCSRTAPCKTFAGAISKTAAHGEINVLDAGGFGTINITKSMTIDGGGSWMASILGSLTTGVIINAPSTEMVTIRNLSINGANTGVTGVRVISAARVLIENCVIFKFQNGILINNTASVTDVAIVNTTVHGNTVNGIHINPTGFLARVSMTGVKAVHNTGVTATTGNGVLVSSVNGKLAATSCMFTHNQNSGVAANNGGGADISNSLMAFNPNGVRSSSLSEIRVYGSTIVQNSTNGVFLDGGAVRTAGNNSVQANAGNSLFTSNIGLQ